MSFSDAERAYLRHAKTLGRLVTIQADGQLHVVPVGWSYNEEHDTIDVTGRDLARTKKFRNVKANSLVAFLVDEVLAPWRPRAVMVQGSGEAIDQGGEGALIRVLPHKVISWGLG